MYFFVHLFLNEALPMLDPVAPTIDNGYPVHFIICVFRSYFNKKNLLIYRTNLCIIVISLTSLVLHIHEPEIVDPPLGPCCPDWYLSMITAFFFMSLGVNALATALIVYRIITVYNDIRGSKSIFQHGNHNHHGQRGLNPLISMLIESQGISTTVVLVRVEVGASYEQTSRIVVNSTN